MKNRFNRLLSPAICAGILLQPLAAPARLVEVLGPSSRFVPGPVFSVSAPVPALRARPVLPLPAPPSITRVARRPAAAPLALIRLARGIYSSPGPEGKKALIERFYSGSGAAPEPAVCLSLGARPRSLLGVERSPVVERCPLGRAPAPVRRVLGPWAASAALLTLIPVVHELGHFLAARLFGRQARMRFNHVLITDAGSLSYPRRIIVDAAGPLFNLALACALAAANLAFAPAPALKAVSWVLSALNLAAGLSNLIPASGAWAGWIAAGERTRESDGRHILDAIREWRSEKRKGLSWKDLSAVDLRGTIPREEPKPLPGVEGLPGDARLVGERTRAVLELEGRFSAMTPRELRNTTRALRGRLKAGESLDGLLPEAFAACREAMARALGKRPYAEQVAAGVGLRMGRVLQQNTGEGKTLSIGLAAYLEALAGPVDVYTFNSYLAMRDATEIGRVLAYLGLRAGALQDKGRAFVFKEGGGFERDDHEGLLARVSRRDAYRSADVLYGYNGAFIFDWLRDRDAPSRGGQVREGRPRRFAIVDEADAELLEEANTDYRIVSSDKVSMAASIRYMYGLAARWKEGEDYTLSPISREAELTDKSRAFLRALAEIDSTFQGWKHLDLLARNAIRAQRILKLNKDYAVLGDEVVILDPHTGRLMWGREWEAGLHRFVEIKEGLDVQGEGRLASHVALDRFMRSYEKVSGITGTLGGSDSEFERAYSLRALRVPPHRPSIRKDLPDRIFEKEAAKLEAAVQEAVAARKALRPVLIGAKDLAESVRIAARLRELGEDFRLLNGVQSEPEKDIVAYAGKAGSLTVATQVAGRGTDIRPGAKALSKGGLHAVLTQRSLSRRVDGQYRGRSARQGEPGSSASFVSLEDDLLRYALPGEMAALREALEKGGDGIEATGGLAEILDAIASRAEGVEENGRDVLRSKDERLDFVRSIYFSLADRLLGGGGLDARLKGFGVRRRHLWTWEPFGRARALAGLREGWGDFAAEYEDLWLEKGVSLGEPEVRRLFEDRVIRPFLEGRGIAARLRGSGREAWAAVSDYFSGSLFSSVPDWAIRRLIDPARIFWHRRLFRLGDRRGWHAFAERHARRVAELRPEDASAHFDHAVALFHGGDIDGSAGEFIRALNEGWENDAAGGITGASMGNLAVCLYNRFLRRREAGDELGALVNLRAAAEIDGSDGRAREWEKAREGLTREQAALAELPFPFLFMPYVFKARSAVDRKRFEDAERLFSRAISINPGSATAFFGRGYARNRLEKSEGARADVLAGFKHLIVRSSQFENMRRIFPRISGQTLDAGAIEEAFSAFHDDTPEGEKGKAPEPSQDDRKLAQRYWSAGRERLRSGRWAEAENYYHWALRCDPFLHPVYGERAYVRSRLGDFRGAFCDYVDCLRFEKLGRSGRLENLIAGHDTVIAWTPDPLAVDKFFSTLKKLAGK